MDVQSFTPGSNRPLGVSTYTSGGLNGYASGNLSRATYQPLVRRRVRALSEEVPVVDVLLIHVRERDVRGSALNALSSFIRRIWPVFFAPPIARNPGGRDENARATRTERERKRERRRRHNAAQHLNEKVPYG